MRFIFLYFLLCASLLNGQEAEDFSDGEITSNPTWMGDIGDFRVNENFKLQLNATAAGSSTIFTNFNFPDSFQFEVEMELDFSPSGSNYARFYFELDSDNISIANGYYIQAGENGSADALEIYKLSNGIATKMGRAMEGAISITNPKVGIRITKRDGNYYLLTDYGFSGSYTQEVIWPIDGTIAGSGIGIQCTYTVSRISNFLFDNIKLNEYRPDVLAPKLISTKLIGNSSLELNWDEALDKESFSVTNFEVTNGIGMPLTAILSATSSSKIELTFDQLFEGGVSYTISVNGIKDLEGNEITEEKSTFSFDALSAVGEVKISEILFNPIGTGSDFVEIYNLTDKTLDLTGMVLGNKTKNEEKPFPSIKIKPKSYIAFTEDKDNIIETYEPLDNQTIVEMDLPSFNNDSGNVYIGRINEDWNETFDYLEDMHNKLIDDVDGISLERLSYLSDSNDKSNWYSASPAVNNATPGYKNSNALGSIENEGFTLESSKFSPNNDGDGDLMRLLYKLDSPGNLLSLNVYDSNGFLVKNIANNELLGTEGAIIWDGTNNEGRNLRIGIYILAGSTFDQNGKTTKIKQVVTLVDYIK